MIALVSTNTRMLVSIITSVYNCQKYIGEMIESVINQTMQEWEMILIDDASTDSTWEEIQKYRDDRIITLRNPQNQGLTKNLNQALSVCRGKYVVRIDGDDIACRDRLEKQVRFMEENPEVVLSGGWMQAFGDAHDTYRSSKDDEVLKVNLLFNAVMYHPTFIIRRDSLLEYNIFYDESLKYAQDYNLEWRLSKYGKLANITDIVTKYRVHGEQVSTDKWEAQRACADATRRNLLEELDVRITEKELSFWSEFCLLRYHTLIENEEKTIRKIQQAIIEKNVEKKIYPHDLLVQVLNARTAEYFARCEEAKTEGTKEPTQNKFYALFVLMNQWVKLKQAGKNLSRYFEIRNMQKIAVYGLSEVGETLLRELQKSGIEVAYAIDRRAGSIFTDFKVVSPDDELECVDAVVVTAITYYDEIAKNLKQKMECPIISLEEVIYDSAL